jgi:ribosomal protein RSM22 (predicted rRNA methylase)
MPSNPDYPAALEQAWLAHAMAVTRAAKPRLAVERLAHAAGVLSDAFTTGREPGFDRYADDRRALAAYGLFFFPRAYARTLRVLRECAARTRLPVPDRGPLRILDLGAGTGAAGLAALALAAERHPDRPLELELVDQARGGFEPARRLFDAGRSLWPHASLRETVGDLRTYRGDTRADLVLASFALNEWIEQDPAADLAAWVAERMTGLRPGGWLVLLEPSLRLTCERMERLRDTLAAARRFRILAPCPHHQACPMLAAKRGWCHEVRQWTAPESLHWINRTLRRDVHLLKFSFLALENAPPADAPWTRLVSPVAREKGKYTAHGCAPDGTLHTLEWLARHLTDDQRAASESLERGDRIHPGPATLLGDQRTQRCASPPTLAADTPET